jgi:hypothetical protein
MESTTLGTVAAIMHNISLGGMCVTNTAGLRPYDQVNVTFNLAGSQKMETFRLAMRVAYCTNRHVGLSFVGMSLEEIKLLGGILSRFSVTERTFPSKH